MTFSRERLLEYAVSMCVVSGRKELESRTEDLLRELWHPDRVVRRSVEGAKARGAPNPAVHCNSDQLEFVTSLDQHPARTGWLLVRTRRPFTTTDAEAANYVLPLLVVLEGQIVAPDSADGATSGVPALTERELQVLRLLPQGLTADAIGRRLGISRLTVRKHLEHTYSKLHCHDRLVAVRRAQEQNLL